MSGNNCFIRLLEDKIFCLFNKKLKTHKILRIKKNLQNFELWTLLFFRYQKFFFIKQFFIKIKDVFLPWNWFQKMMRIYVFRGYSSKVSFGRNRALISTNLESILTSFTMFCLISYDAQSFCRDHFKRFWKSETGKSYPRN